MQTVKFAKARIARHRPYNGESITFTTAFPYDPLRRSVFRSAAMLVGGK